MGFVFTVVETTNKQIRKDDKEHEVIMTDQKRRPGRPGREVDPENYSIIARNIDRRMSDIGMPTKVELARVSEVSRTVITNIFIMPNKGVMGDSAVKLAKALQCRVEWLITGEGPVTDDQITGVPVFKTTHLSKSTIEELLAQAQEFNEARRTPCPAGYKSSAFGIELDSTTNFDSCSKYKKFEKGGTLFFDKDKTPSTGDLVLVKTSSESTPEIMEYTHAREMTFFSTLNDNLPESVRTIQFSEEMKVIGVNVGYSIIANH